MFKRGNKWQYDFWVDGKRYRGSIPEARVKAQAERAEVTIRDSVYEGIYGKSVDAPKLRDFIRKRFCRGQRLTSERGCTTCFARVR